MEVCRGIQKCPLLGGVRYWEVSVSRGFTALSVRFSSCNKAVVNVFPHKAEPYYATRTGQYLSDYYLTTLEQNKSLKGAD